MSLYFCYSSYADHRDLHSFPTRRSSDLSPERLDLDGVVGDSQALEQAIRPDDHIRRPADVVDGAIEVLRCFRSEEHTSELQSLRHLVCRLLLEKKKTQQ